MSDRRDALAPYVPALVAAVLLGGAVGVGLWRGAPAVVLWLAFGALSGSLLLFWETARTLVDPRSRGDDPAEDDNGVPEALATRKKAALRALKDIAFERSIGRLNEEDYAALETRYRAEARDAMKALDEDYGPYLGRAEALLAAAETPSDAKPNVTPETPADTSAAKPSCPSCGASNDHDAVFCKKCGARVAAEVAS